MPVYRAKFNDVGLLLGMYPDDVWPLTVADESKPIVEPRPLPGWVPPADDPDAEAPVIEVVVGFETMPSPALPEGLIEITEEQYQDLLGHPGQRKWQDGAVVTFVPSPVPPSIPASISDRQFFQQLAVAGIVTEDEALASNAAVIPAPLLAIIEQMPEDQQFAAKMVVSGATTFDRQHPMTIAIGTAYGMSAEQIDEFFAAAAVL